MTAGKNAVLILEIILSIKHHAPHCPFLQAVDCHKIKTKLLHVLHGNHRHAIRHYVNIRIHLPAGNSCGNLFALFQIIDTVDQGHRCSQLMGAGHTFHRIIKSVDSSAFCPRNYNAIRSFHRGQSRFYLGKVNIHRHNIIRFFPGSAVISQTFISPDALPVIKSKTLGSGPDQSLNIPVYVQRAVTVPLIKIHDQWQG